MVSCKYRVRHRDSSSSDTLERHQAINTVKYNNEHAAARFSFLAAAARTIKNNSNARIGASEMNAIRRSRPERFGEQWNMMMM